MRRVGLYLILGIIFALISFFLLQELSPFNPLKIEELIQSEEIEEGDFIRLNNEIDNLIDRGLIVSYLSENAYIVFFCIILSILFLFISIHLIIDKLFFKNFYENASHFDAVRRALLLGISIGLLVFAKLSNAEIYVFLLLVIIPLLIEIVFKMYFQRELPLPKELPHKPLRRIEEDGKHISYEDALSDLRHIDPEIKRNISTDRNI